MAGAVLLQERYLLLVRFFLVEGVLLALLEYDEDISSDTNLLVGGTVAALAVARCVG